MINFQVLGAVILLVLYVSLLSHKSEWNEVVIDMIGLFACLLLAIQFIGG